MTTPVYEWPRAWYRENSGSFALRSASQISSRPWVGGKSVYGPHAQMWQCKMMMAPQTVRWWPAMAAFFSRLDGQAGLVRIGHYARLRPQFDRDVTAAGQGWSDGTFFDDGTGWEDGPLPATAFLAAAATRGDKYVTIGGLPASTTRVLRRGDLFEIRPNGVSGVIPHLYEAQFDGPTDADGETGIEIRPRLRANVARGDQVVLRDPTSVFRLIDDEQGAQDISAPGLLANFGFTLIEAIPT